MTKLFERVALVNRGEPAMRFIAAVRELNEEQNDNLTAIALYTEPDREAMFVREAAESHLLGPATFVDEKGDRNSTYLDLRRLEAALMATRAEAVWVGWGFVAERPEFVELCERLGIVFIGPSSDTMRQLGDKITAKRIATEAQVPVAPWSEGAVDSIEEAIEHGRRIGFPLMIKATAGGGGRGIRAVRSEHEIPEAFASARSEARKAFGDPTLFLERMVPGARHVEVQIIADSSGTTWALGVRDCTLQRRNQKIVEESPSPVLTSEQQTELEEAAVRLTKAIGYRNAGTVEFLYDQESRQFYFMEVNARLQVEHPVTELVTGVDLVKLQIDVARGGELNEPPTHSGHAIEVRLNAEDPEDGFAPAPGLVERLRLSSGPGLRIDQGVAEGDVIPTEFDSMIAKIIAHGRTREEAVARLCRTLLQSAVAIRGGATNKGFLLNLLRSPEVRQGEYDVGWIDRLVEDDRHVPRHHGELALLQAAIEEYDSELSVERAQFYNAASRGRPRMGESVGRKIELSHCGNAYEIWVFRLGTNEYRVKVDELEVEVSIDRLRQGEQRLEVNNRTYRTQAIEQGLTYLVEVDGVPHRLSRERGGVVRAPAPSIVVNTLVNEGDEVEVGDGLIVIEAMKLEMTITAKFSGRVREIMVMNNVQVETGSPLLLVEPLSEEASSVSANRLDFRPLVNKNNGAQSIRTYLAQLRSLVLGYDVEADSLTTPSEAIEAALARADGELIAAEDEIINTFVDISALVSRRGKMGNGADARSPEQCFFHYLGDLSSQADGLPPSFVRTLHRALGHYSVPEIERTPALEESLFRLYKSHQRVDDQIAPILALLQRRLACADQLRPRGTVAATPRPPSGSFRTLLRRTISVSQGTFPSINDLARELLFQYFNKPVLDEVAERALARAETTIAYLREHPGASDRDERIGDLVDCPQHLLGLFSGRLNDATANERRDALETLVRRYYRIRQLEDLRILERRDMQLATASYQHDKERIHIIAAHVHESQLTEVLQAIRPLADDRPLGHDVVLDLYVETTEPASETEVVEQIQALLEEAGFAKPLRRVVVAIYWPKNGKGFRVQHSTFRHGPAGFQEEQIYRGLHPMQGKRLQMWRLQDFDLERLASPEEIYVFRATGRTNAKDERLIALGEVRDLTAMRDRQGKLVSLPAFERVFSEAIVSIRHFQSRRKVRQRLHWNRVQLFVVPPFDLHQDELKSVVAKMTANTEGLGLERILIQGHFRDPATGQLEEKVLDIANPDATGPSIRYREIPSHPMQPISEYAQKVLRLKRRGLVYPYELIAMLTQERDNVQTELPPGAFQEYDLNSDNELLPVDREPGLNEANVVVGVITNFTQKYPEGLTRVAILSDPSHGMGALAEPECRRIEAAIELAEQMKIPVEWFAVSAGAKISMESGVENMDWIGGVLRKLVNHTQAGGEVNIIVCGVTVGAQPYWNAEATMLMHTRGVLIMAAQGTMVLTGKQALDYSGGVSAEDNHGIGGYDRIMGPNGQAQYSARDVAEACKILMTHYDHSYKVPGERFPRRAFTRDSTKRDVCTFPHGQCVGQNDFATVGDVFDPNKNPGRKKPFDIRKVMRAVTDQDHAPLERWTGMRNAEMTVVWDAHLGGIPVCLIGLESHPLTRLGMVPADGPGQWTAGTLFPMSSKKLARAINAASDNRPVVILANLSGFDGSPESMRKLQLEYGAEIGRAVVNFRGPMVFCVISRYHGGAFVVFSNRLNDQLESAALDGAYASVIGGAPAAAVVFSGEVKKRTRQDPRVREIEEQHTKAKKSNKVMLRGQLDKEWLTVETEKLREVAEEFDGIHSVHRAQAVGAIHRIVPPRGLRPYLVDAVERGMKRELELRP